MRANGAKLGDMGLGEGIKRRLGAMSAKGRAGFAVVAVSLTALLTPVVYGLAGDFIFGAINDQIVALVGPHLPAVGKAIGSYFFSFVAAGGLLWFAASWGYWIGIKDPIAIGSSTQNPGAKAKEKEEASVRLDLLSAMSGIRRELSLVDKRVQRSYNGDEERDRILAAHRPAILAHLALIRKSGFVTPQLENLNTAEAAVLGRYVAEVEPYVENGLIEEARRTAGNITVTIMSVLEKMKLPSA